MLAQQVDSDMCWIVDEKTTKGLGASWQYQWDMRGQFYGYTWAGLVMGYNMQGTIVRGIAIQQTQFGFQEKALFFTRHQLDLWWKEANRKIALMIEMFEKARSPYYDNDLRTMHDAFPMSFGEACGSYGGCFMKDACVQEKPWDLYRSWETRIWDPLADDPAGESSDRTKDMADVSFKEFMGM
ncbi:MAG: hypothetical protein IIC59_11745 [Proteobacteria bacterium]|nr:hypothetical protein [Pseudomonadota bacterium]